MFSLAYKCHDFKYVKSHGCTHTADGRAYRRPPQALRDPQARGGDDPLLPQGHARHEHVRRRAVCDAGGFLVEAWWWVIGKKNETTSYFLSHEIINLCAEIVARTMADAEFGASVCWQQLYYIIVRYFSWV